ncbi:hypothetical protein K474DRAFT_1657349 [Panus rudis PR-1116 ss-1]|nr:hypothetical protein K474DRAFT_1668782 [Panus rudis PR-1116 ss-1]KAI0077538.1 hypothetical protein K474DRAFT_1661635 [Panus rudis PR-1116 ss-1]KAI0080850.1 hypothetical protein K474DRAFT_1657349 [Panus rudis PR-1116 ss-1]
MGQAHLPCGHCGFNRLGKAWPCSQGCFLPCEISPGLASLIAPGRELPAWHAYANLNLASLQISGALQIIH